MEVATEVEINLDFVDIYIELELRSFFRIRGFPIRVVADFVFALLGPDPFRNGLSFVERMIQVDDDFSEEDGHALTIVVCA